MAKYTTMIRTVVEAGHPLFDFDYPIFDRCYRQVLERKIINHYYFREIGLETVGQFKHFLMTRLNEIMPYYNQLYQSTLIEFNPMYNLDTTETFDRRNDTNQNENSNSDSTTKTQQESSQDSTLNAQANMTNTQENELSENNNNKNIYQDTPTSRLGNTDFATNITDDEGNRQMKESQTHDTVRREDTDSKITTDLDSTGNTNTDMSMNRTINNTEDYIRRQTGTTGTKFPAEIIMEWRRSFLNIDVMIIEELQDLFMNIY